MRFCKQACISYRFSNPNPNPNPNPNLNPNPNPTRYSSYKSSLFARVKLFSTKALLIACFNPFFQNQANVRFRTAYL